MQYSLIRFLDVCLGKPLCVLFFLLSNVIPRPAKESGLDAARKILVVRFWGIGSIILLSPTLAAIRRKFPQAEITFLTLEQNAGLYEYQGLFDTVRYLPLKSLSRFPRDCVKLLRALRREHFDLVIDCEQFCRFSTLLSFLTLAPYRVGFATPHQLRGLLYTLPVPYDDVKHVTQVFMDLAKTLGASPGPHLIPLQATDDERQEVDRLFQAHHLSGHHLFIGFNINCGQYAVERRWPQEYFAELADALIADCNAKILFFGGAEDEAYVRQAILSVKRKDSVVDFAGKLTLHQLSYAAEQCTLFVSNDSGPLHLAVAANVPTVSFFGPETPYKYGPRGWPHVVLYKDLPCSPCMSVFGAKSVNCTIGVRCLRTITPAEAYNKIRMLLEDLEVSRTGPAQASLSGREHRQEGLPLF